MSKSFKVIGSVLVVVACVIIVFASHEHTQKFINQADNSNHTEQVLSNDYSNKQQRLTNQVIQDSATSKNSKLRAYGQNTLDMNTIDKPINQFLNVVYNWDSESEYNARTKELANVATPNVLSNKAIFGSDKDSSGDSSIQMLGTHSSCLSSKITELSQNGNNITALVSCNHKSWETSKNQSSSNGATAQQWYIMTVNTKSNKITKLQKVYENTNINI